jgi:hypothetical protein
MLLEDPRPLLRDLRRERDRFLDLERDLFLDLDFDLLLASSLLTTAATSPSPVFAPIRPSIDSGFISATAKNGTTNEHLSVIPSNGDEYTYVDMEAFWLEP